MINPVHLTSEEEAILLSHYRKSKHLVIRERAHAILLNSKSYSTYKISEIIFRDEKTVREWIKDFNERRISSIFPKYFDNTNASKLTREQKEEIGKVLASPPSEYGLPKKFWEVESLKSYIKAEFGIEYESDNSYRFIFKLSNFSYHLPAKFSVKRDEAFIKNRILELRKLVANYINEPNWEVLVGDETRLIWEAIIRRAWLPKGERTILKVIREKTYQNFFGFLNLRTGLPYIYEIPWQNEDTTIKVLTILKNEPEHKGKKILLIWDNASWHKSLKLREKLKTELSVFYLENFAPHAPETNPEEHIWEYAKEEISNSQFESLTELTFAFKSAVMGRNYPYQI